MRWTITVERKLEHYEQTLAEYKQGKTTVEEECWAGEPEDVIVMYWYMVDDPQYMLFNDLAFIVKHIGDRKRLKGRTVRVKYGRQLLYEHKIEL